jgi:hypothetical protein
VVGLVAVIMVSINFYLYGQIASPYMNGEGPKFSLANFGAKTYQLFIDGTFLTGNAVLSPDPHPHQLLERFPYLLLVLPGAIYLWRERGPAIWGFFLAVAFTLTFYLSYGPAASVPYFWTYGSYHYIWWITPWFGFFAYLSLRQAPFVLPWRLYLVALVIPLAIVLGVGFSVREVAASDAPQNRLETMTVSSGQVYTVNMVAPENVGTIQDIRLTFQTPPPYPGTSCDTGSKVKVTVNNAAQADYAEIKISQDGPYYDISFLNKGLALKKGDRISVAFSDAPDTRLARAALRQVYFVPGGTLGKFFTR